MATHRHSHLLPEFYEEQSKLISRKRKHIIVFKVSAISSEMGTLNNININNR